MRRATIVAALAAPVLAAAQTTTTPGAGVIVTSDEWLNAAQCTGADTTSGVLLSWQVALGAGISVTTGAQFQLFAATGTTNPFPSPITNAGATGQTCTASGRVPIGPAIPTMQATATNVSYTKSVIASAFANTCAADATLWLCVELTNPPAIATGSMTLSVVAPAPPKNISVTSGSEALNVAWSAPDTTPVQIGAYKAKATAVDPTQDGFVHWSPQVSAANTDVRLSGLKNDVPYNVVAVSYSQSGTQSAESTPAVVGTPRPEEELLGYYEGVGGRGRGGCGTPAAALSLLGAAALLAARRRK